MNTQRVFAELVLAPCFRRPALPRPYGDYMPGAQRAGMVDDKLLDRVPWWYDGSKVYLDAQNYRLENHSAPPDPWALAGVGKILRNPAKYGHGPGGIHAFFDLEPTPDRPPVTLPVVIAAVKALRAATTASQKISVYAWPGGDYPESTSALRQELAGMLVYDGYSRREHAMNPGTWESEMAAVAARFKREFPRKRTWTVFLTPRWQIYGPLGVWPPEVEALRDKPVGLERWGEQLAYARGLGFTPFIFGAVDSLDPDPEVAPYLAMANGMRSVPALEVA
jgi:hypothetical protein